MEIQDSFNKVVVITGASAGVGRAVAREFASHGARIALLARGEDGLEGARKEVEERGGEAIAIPTDVSDYEQVETAAARVEETFGPIDVWINNAMATVFSPFEKIEPEEFKRVTEVTYLGQVYGAKAALNRMLPRDRGQVILVGSALAYRGIPLQSAYCGAKHAVQGFFESLRTELIHEGSNVKLGTVHLPALNTTQFNIGKSKLPKKARPMGTIFQPEVAARAIYDMARHPKREVYVGYSTLQTIFGNKFVPEFLDHYLANTAFQGQLTEEPEDPGREDNLWDPVPGDHGAHGNFDDQAWEVSPQYWIASRPWIARAAVAAAGLGLGIILDRLFSEK